MREKITAVTDEIMVSYSRALKNALKLEANIEESMQEGEGTIYFTIADEKSSGSGYLEIGDDLPKIARGAVFGAYCELARVTIFVKGTGEEIRVINPVGKAIANGIIRDMSRQEVPKGVIESLT